MEREVVSELEGAGRGGRREGRRGTRQLRQTPVAERERERGERERGRARERERWEGAEGEQCCLEGESAGEGARGAHCWSISGTMGSCPTAFTFFKLFCATLIAAQRRSPGCGLPPPTRPGREPLAGHIFVRDQAGLFGVVRRKYDLNLPAVYNETNPASLVLVFHGFFDTDTGELNEDLLPAYINFERRNVVTLYPRGSGDEWSGDSYGWNVDGNGLNRNLGPLGRTCRIPREDWLEQYACFDSCIRTMRGCDYVMGCNFASCMDDRAFIRALLARTLRSLCIDLNRIHATGISAGGMMTYQVALDFGDVVGSVAPIAGSRIYGFNKLPRVPISLLEVHGYDDDTVPANASNGLGGGPPGSSVSNDHFFYTEVPYILGAFAVAAGCTGPNMPFPTRFDGIRGFQCNMPRGACGAHSIVQCTGKWGHTWPLHLTRPFAYAGLVLDFFAAHPLQIPDLDADGIILRLLACPDCNGTLKNLRTML